MPPPAEEANTGHVPMLDLKKQHESIADEVKAAVDEVVGHQRFVNGPELDRFEEAMAGYLGAKHAIGVSSGTDALLVTLMALGVGEGDEIITTPFSFVSAAEVIARLGARPMFADVLPENMLIRPAAVQQLLSSRTRAIIPVHLYGQVCEVGQLIDLSRDRRVPLIEDCAQSLGARLDDRAAGTFGLAGTFSFFPSKNLGAWGDGGLVVTDDAALAEKIRLIRNHGSGTRDRYELLGGNFRLDTLQAAVLRIKLAHLDEWLAARRMAARYYGQLFAEAGLSAGPNETRHPGHRILLPPVWDDDAHCFNLFVIQAEKRDELKKYLAAKDIDTAVYYTTPLHLQPCFSDLDYRKGDFPVAEEAARKVLALPLFAEITRQQQKRVVEAIAEFYHGA